MYDRKNLKKFEEIMRQRFTLRLSGEKEKYRRFISIFNYCLKSLNDESQKILNNSYLNMEFKYWWVEHYPRTTFYRKRNKAISSFVRLFEVINENFNDFANNIASSIN